MNEELIVGIDRLKNPSLNKSTAFTLEERDKYKLHGLLPTAITTQDTQLKRVLANLHRQESNIARYIFLNSLQSRNERLFFRLVSEHIKEILPIIYTPTVGEACQEFAHIYQQQKGLTLSATDRGQIKEVLQNWPHKDVRIIVVTDGERILGLGDLGANGMGIPIGKLSLYTACAGIHPEYCMPVMLDVGTNNVSLREDPLYLGLTQKRIQGDEYLSLVDEFVQAVQEIFPKALIQFEDFLTPNAYVLLEKYRKSILCFNDDIQGTAAMALSGVLASCRITGHAFKDLRLMFLGAGSAATGIGDLIKLALVAEGLTESEAVQRLWFVDENGLICKERDDLMPHNLPYAHEQPMLSFIGAINHFKPHVLIGATGVGGTFNSKVVKAMCKHNEHPVLLSLSNPTSRSECTAQQAYEWSDGNVIFASGSPFPPVTIEGGRHFIPGQGNNVYIFPGVGLGALAGDASIITDEMFLIAAKTLAKQVSKTELLNGTIYPDLDNILDISLLIAEQVATYVFEQGLNRSPQPGDIKKVLQDMMYNTIY
ncbi:MAG: NAD-dependent malic enzyme [Methylomonas lenta]|nr:NAD-dependent malic enzyme [Methylomonas lenta]